MVDVFVSWGRDVNKDPNPLGRECGIGCRLLTRPDNITAPMIVMLAVSVLVNIYFTGVRISRRALDLI